MEINEAKKSIIFIGPSAVGKSTMARWFSTTYDIPYYSADIYINDYFKEYKSNNNISASNIYEYIENFTDKELLKKEWETFLVEFVFWFLEKLDNSNIMQAVCFVASHTLFENKDNFMKIQNKLSEYNNTILLLPSKDYDKSMHILNGRGGWESLNESIINSENTYNLAHKTVYNEDLSEEGLFDKINDLLLEDYETRYCLYHNQFKRRSDCNEQVEKHLNLYKKKC